jgi:succinoglycan biosynthesis transport protein ExoP
MTDRQPAQSADWLQPPLEQEGLQRYAETLRERAGLIALVAVLATLAAIFYVLTAAKTYRAEADLLITPISADNTTLASLGLITQSPDPTRDVETAARLATTTDVANRVRQTLKTTRSARSLLADVQAEPVAQSNIVAIVASAGSPTEARDLANAFAEAGVANRADAMHRLIDQALPRVRAQAAGGAGGGPGSPSDQLGQLQLLRGEPDPTFRLETHADLPTHQASPRPALSIGGGLIAGLVLGIAAAFGLQSLDPRLRREEQLRRLYRLPILGRIPKESGRATGEGPIGPRSLSSPAAEAYRTLRTTLLGPHDSGSRAILITGPSASGGKSTTALNLASSLALAGRRVILIDADLRRPALASALGVRTKKGVVSVLIENVSLRDALTPVPSHGNNLALLAADYEGDWIADLFSIPAANRLVEDAKELADYVIIDSPPLTEVVDALPMARMVDDVLVVVRLDSSPLAKITQLGELLAESGIKPAGFTVVGTARPGRGSYYYHQDDGARSGIGAAGQRALGQLSGTGGD